MGQRECVLRWLSPASPRARRKYNGHIGVAQSVEDVFSFIEEAERKVYARKGIVSAVCLDDASGECLYVGGAGGRWSLYYLRMPEVGDGELFARPVGDPTAEGTTPVIEEMVDDIENTHFVLRDIGEQAIREWWRSKTLWTGVKWYWMKG